MLDRILKFLGVVHLIDSELVCEWVMSIQRSWNIVDRGMVFSSLTGVKAIYCHATSKDAAKADPAGDVRAETLAKAAASAGVEHIVYNSTGITWISRGRMLVCHVVHKFWWYVATFARQP